MLEIKSVLFVHRTCGFYPIAVTRLDKRRPSLCLGRRAGRDLKIRRTKDIIDAAEKGLLPDKIMINVHPKRWTDDFMPWVKELVGQKVKNVVKRQLNKFRD